MSTKDRWIMSLAVIGASLLGGAATGVSFRSMPEALAQNGPMAVSVPRYQVSSWGWGTPGSTAANNAYAPDSKHGAYIIDTQTGELFSVDGTTGKVTALGSVKK